MFVEVERADGSGHTGNPARTFGIAPKVHRDSYPEFKLITPAGEATVEKSTPKRAPREGARPKLRRIETSKNFRGTSPRTAKSLDMAQVRRAARAASKQSNADAAALKEAIMRRFPPAADRWERTPNAKYDDHKIIIKKINGKNVTFTYAKSSDMPAGATDRNPTMPIDKRLTTLDGTYNGGMTLEKLSGRRRLGWKPSHDIPRRREHFHHSFVNRVIRESERQS